MFRPSVTVPFTLGLCLLASVFLYQNCSQYLGKHPYAMTTEGSSTEPTVTDTPDPTAFSVPKPQYGPAQALNAGDFYTLQAGVDAGVNIMGRALLIRTADGQTRVDVSATGLPPNSLVPAHVHVLPCAQGAGGHYKIDTSIADAKKSNEIWPLLYTDANGYGFGTVTVNHLARAEAVAVVIHGAGGAKVACADLTVAAPTPSIDAGNFASAGTGPSTITGRAMLVRKSNGVSEVRTAVSGLANGTAYASHLHDGDCAGTLGHYKIDPTIAASIEANEIWPLLMSNATGQAFGFKAVNHVVRTGVHSVWIHNPVGGAQLACAPLADAGGAFLPLSTGLTRARNVGGVAVINRELNGGTTFSVSVTGLAPSTTYMAHVHNRACLNGDAGGHYKVDATVAAAVQQNEIWLSIVTDATGAGVARVTTPHVARPDATSIVIHDPSDAAKLACADLY